MQEQLYNDFITKLLPKVQEGLTISYEYFLDLFGRYIKYLMITDAIILVASLLGFMGIIYVTHKIRTQIKDGLDDMDMWPGMYLLFSCLVLLYLFFSVIFSANDLIKSIFIPEVRVYEEISRMNYRPN